MSVGAIAGRHKLFSPAVRNKAEDYLSRNDGMTDKYDILDPMKVDVK